MTQQEILDYNKRCAEFLGYILREDNCYNGDDKLVAKFSYLRINDLKFHSDWNWIMEVVEAIEDKSKYTILGRDLYESFDIGRQHVKFYFSPNNQYLLQLELKQFLPDEPWIHTMYKHHIVQQFDFKTHGKQGAVVQAINQFLIWYEQNK